MHSNRTVIHPDFAGLGMGIKLINSTSIMMSRAGYDVRAKYTSTPVYLAMRKFPCWQLTEIRRDLKDRARRSDVAHQWLSRRRENLLLRVRARLL